VRKPVFIFGIAIVAVALAFVLTDSVLITLGAGVTEANVHRIRVGMTKPQVERILRVADQYVPISPPDSAETPDGELGLWGKSQLQVLVTFDRDGRVRSASYYLEQGGELTLSSGQGWARNPSAGLSVIGGLNMMGMAPYGLPGGVLSMPGGRAGTPGDPSRSRTITQHNRQIRRAAATRASTRR
jgi:hypothetical protein